MDLRQKEALEKHREEILLDLDVLDVIDFLVEKNLVDAQTKGNILNNKDRKREAESLLDLLPQRGAKAFGYFVEALKADYEWLATKLEEALEFNETKTEQEDVVDSDEQGKSRLREILMLGGVPSLPSHNIVRTESVTKLKEMVSELLPGQFLAIHGMPGSGKSVLAAEVVHDQDVTLTDFPNGVFWFRVGMLENDGLLHRMKILCEKLDHSASPTSIEHAQEILRRSFMSERYTKSLLILDDVWSTDIIRAFVISARVLVTTRDISVLDVVPKQDQKILEINTGFSEAESLELFSKYTGIAKEFLPDEAKQIHEESKGSPMVISLIGSFISESGRHSQMHRQSGRWSYYLNNLKHRRFSKLKKNTAYEYTSLMEAVLTSIEHLPDNLKDRYKELVVFYDDAAIPQSVLMTYWDLNDIEVDNLMTEFLRKSLATSVYDMTLESYVYTIHDIQLEYLKTQLKDDEEKEKAFHKHFLDQYFKKANYVYGNIADDSYIFYNFGYHLYKSEQFELFPKVFLDLGFVEAMLKATSSVDLLNDYKRYEHHIIGPNDEYLNELEDFEAFARTIGAIVSSTEHSDIIQLALREPESSAVYQAAKKLAESRPERLYFEWLNRDLVRGKHSATILHHGIVEAAKFLPDMTKILTTNGEGQIKIWDVTSGEVLHRFTGHKSGVKTLAISSEGDIFASGSEDGCIKIWDLGSFVDDSENGNEKQHAILRKGSVRGRSSQDTPRTKQTVNHLLTYDHGIRDLSNQSFVFLDLHPEAVLCVDISPDGEEVIAAGQSGHVKIFNLRARQLRLTITGHEEAVNVCRFSKNGQTICTGSNDTTIRLWDAETGECRGKFERHNLAVLDLAFVTGSNKILSMSSNKLMLWNVPVVECEPCLDLIEFRRSRESDFICMKLSNNSRLLAASTVDNIVTVWDVASAQVLLALPGHSSHIYALDFTHDDMFLLSGSTDETVMIWALETLSDESRVLESEEASLGLGPAFDVKFLGDTARMVAMDDANCLQIIDDGKQKFVSPAESTTITALNLSENGQVVSYGCSNGSVRIFYPVSGTIKTLGMHNSKVTDIKIRTQIKTSVEEINIDPIVISASEDGCMKMWHEGGPTFDCTGHKYKVQEVHFVDCDERFFALSRSTNGSLRTWDVETGTLVRTWSISVDEGIQTTVTSMDISHSASLVAVGTANGKVILLNMLELRSDRIIEVQRDQGPVRVVRFNHDGSLLVTGHDTGIIEVWDAKTWTKLYRSIPLHQSWVTDLQWSHDDVHLVSVGDKLAWWSLEFMPKKKLSQSVSGVQRKPLAFRRSRAESERSSLGEVFVVDQLIPPSPHNLPPTPNLAKSPSRVIKEGIQRNRELLQVFEIRGGTMSKVITSKDFKKFVTLDDAGSAYFLQEIQSVTKF